MKFSEKIVTFLFVARVRLAGWIDKRFSQKFSKKERNVKNSFKKTFLAKKTFSKNY
jgi:hypothetical protein